MIPAWTENDVQLTVGLCPTPLSALPSHCQAARVQHGTLKITAEKQHPLADKELLIELSKAEVSLAVDVKNRDVRVGAAGMELTGAAK